MAITVGYTFLARQGEGGSQIILLSPAQTRIWVRLTYTCA